MAIQDPARVYTTYFLREAEWANEIRDQGAYNTDS